MRGRYKSSGGSGIPIGAFNVPRGSVKVTAGGRVLVEGVDYTVNYQIGTVQILDPSLQAQTFTNSGFCRKQCRFWTTNKTLYRNKRRAPI